VGHPGLPPLRAARAHSAPHRKAIDPDEIGDRPKSGMTGAGRAPGGMLVSEVRRDPLPTGRPRTAHGRVDQEFSLAAGRQVVVSLSPPYPHEPWHPCRHFTCARARVKLLPQSFMRIFLKRIHQRSPSYT